MRFLVLGSGLMGKGIVHDLSRQKDISEILLADADIEKANKVAREVAGDSDVIRPVAFSATDANRVRELMEGCKVALGATSYDHNVLYSKAAIDAKCHFVDLGGNHDIVAEEFTLSEQAKQAGVAIMPDCGLAPGLVNILAHRAIHGFDLPVAEVQIRVGGVPMHPKPPLNYFLVFSARGLVNEYVEPAKVILDGKVAEVDSLEGLETLHFPEPFGEMEAFYTSGGISTLIDTMPGKVKDLSYKTIRYPGHKQYIKFLFDMGFASYDAVDIKGTAVAPRYVLDKVLERKLRAENEEDVILVRVTAEGAINGVKSCYCGDIIDHCDRKHNLTAMMRMTAFPAAIIAQMLARGDISGTGALYQELAVPTDKFFKELEKRDIRMVEQTRQLQPAK